MALQPRVRTNFIGPDPKAVHVLWRAVRAPFADLTGEGARRYGGRWNSPGRPVVYLAEHPALAILEVRVNLDVPPELLPDDFLIVKYVYAGASVSQSIEPLGDLAETKALGDAWLTSERSTLLQVPNVLAPESWNYLLNPLHVNASTVLETARYPFQFDGRLFQVTD